ncbi:tyrosine-protein phosphatase non-receptor type 9-like [Cotesia glomerata]|uniref:tyrosine-protein phosphatase non-receptor type 9-like n=1 Tax=Cotesia glomerata TaxID=32391 RepID=UPI001D03331C|nr:tyrosine-protein phosphatase non-receptor type 9-like [Cotesia glomerata]
MRLPGNLKITKSTLRLRHVTKKSVHGVVSKHNTPAQRSHNPETELNTSDTRYWPSEEDGTLQVAQYTIRTLKKKTFSNYIVTELSVTHEFNERQRKVYHFVYIDWTEDGNFNDVGKFYKFVLAINHMREVVQTIVLSYCEIIGPIIVHCSTGIGRTGVFSVIDYVLHQLKKNGKISLPKILIGIRQQRHSSVVILDQYLFCYRVVLHCLAEINNRLRDKEKTGLLRTS